MGKPNLVKDICTRLPLDLCFVIGLGQAFQKVIENNWLGLNWVIVLCMNLLVEVEIRWHIEFGQI